MVGMQFLAKSFGLDIKDEHLQAIEKLIPELPGMVTTVYKNIETTLANVNTRCDRLELHIQQLTEENHDLLSLLRSYMEQQQAPKPEPVKEVVNGRTVRPTKSRTN
jgi:hypothetical protein